MNKPILLLVFAILFLIPADFENAFAGPPQTGSIGDFVWDDLDGDGIQDAGEPGASGVTVNLLDEFFDLFDTTVTDANGFYQFTDLDPGVYNIEFIPPAGKTFTLFDQGGDDNLDSDVPNLFGVPDTIVLADGEINDSIDAGLIPKAAIGDFVWDDLDGDGIQDAGEPGASGVTVNLLDEFFDLFDTTVTDANGFYQFTDLDPGVYNIEFIPPAGKTFTLFDQGGDDNLDSDVPNLFGVPDTIVLADGEINDSIDAGLLVTEPSNDLVGGEIIPIETSSLLVSAVQTNLSWIVTAAAIVAGASAFFIRRR